MVSFVLGSTKFNEPYRIFQNNTLIVLIISKVIINVYTQKQFQTKNKKPTNSNSPLQLPMLQMSNYASVHSIYCYVIVQD